MRLWFRSLFVLARERWSWVIGCAILMFLLPEYIAPVLAVIALLLARADLKARGQTWAVGDAGRWIWLYILCMLLSVTYSKHPWLGFGTVLMWLVGFAFYLALTAVITSPERLRRLLQLLTFAVGLMGFIACVQYFGACVFGWPRLYYQLWNPLNEKVFEWLPLSLRLYSDGVRVAATFDNPNVFAETMVCLLPFAVYGATTSRRTRTKFIYLGCLLFGVVGMAFAFSRASYLCLFAMACVFLIFNASRLARARNALIFLVLVMVLLIATPNVFTERMATLNLHETSVAERIRIWEAALPAIAEHPLFGTGAGVQGAGDIMAAAGLPGVPHAHNLYLQLLIEGGALSLTAFMIVVVRMLHTQATMAEVKTKRGFHFGISFFAALCGFLLYGLMDFPLLSPKLVCLFWILMTLSDLSASFYADSPLLTLSRKRRDTHA